MSVFGSVGAWLKGSFNQLIGRGKEPAKVIFLGLDAAGKTTFFYKIKSRFDEVATAIPTIGFIVETLDIQQKQIVCWDVGGCDKIRPLWRHYFEDAKMLIFMIDSNDHERFDVAKEEVEGMIRFAQFTGPVLVIANKQDLPRAKRKEEIVERLGLHQMLAKNPWTIVETVATTGEGCAECMRWMEDVVSGRFQQSTRPAEESTEEAATAAVDAPSSILANEKAPAASVSEELTHKDDHKAPAVTINSQGSEYDEHQERLRKQRWTDWLDREDNDDAMFLQQTVTYELDVWDHYTHVRLGFLLLRQHGNFETGLEAVKHTIEDYIANSSRTNGKSYHCTMTTFWISHIAHWMSHLATTSSAPSSTPALESSASAADWSALHFKALLQHAFTHHTADSDLTDKGLFRKYYEDATIFGAPARASFVAPDKQPLPLC